MLKREDSQQVTPTGTLKLAAHHTSLLGERARLHTLHLQASPPIPGSPHKSRRRKPISSTYREICEGYTCGKERTVIRSLDRDGPLVCTL